MLSRRHSSVLLLAAAGLLSACTSLNVQRLTATSSDHAREGITYYLPLKQFVISTNFELQSCEIGSAGPVLGFQVSSKVAESQIPDLTERYSISYQQLSALTKTTDISATVSENGLLAAINAAASDQTGPILANVLSAGFAIARGNLLGQLSQAAGPGLMRTPSPNELRQRPKDSCTEVNQRLLKVQEAKEARDAALVEDEKRAAAGAVRLKAATALASAEAKLTSAIESKDPAAIQEARADVQLKKDAFVAATKLLQELGSSDSAKKSEALAAARKKLTVSNTLIWAPVSREMSPGELARARIEVPMSAIAALELRDESLLAAAQKQLQAEAVLDAPAGVQEATSPKQGDLTARAGIVYRQPAHVLLRVCAAKCDGLNKDGAFVAEQFAYAAVHAVPQFGVKASLPLTNFLFEDNSLAVTFGESGQPKVVTFKSKAAAERAAASAKTIGDSYLEFIKGREADRLEFLKNRRADEEGQLNLESLRRDARIDTLSDRLDVVKKLEALEAARSGTATRNQLLEESLEARKRQLKLQIEIKEQENRLRELGAPVDQ